VAGLGQGPPESRARPHALLEGDHAQPGLRPTQRASIDLAKASGYRYTGRKPSFTRSPFEAVRDLLGQDAGVSMIAKATGLSRQTLYRIKDDAASSEAALVNWGR
jgi:DNA invertase Pin-like site-specific DNA recombinase